MRCDAMRCDAMRCDAMRCDAMRCDAMRCDAMRCDAMRCDAMRCDAMRCDAMRCDAMRCDAMRCDAMRCDAMRCDAMRCDAMRCDAMRCDAMRCDAMRCDAMRCDAMRCDAMRCDAMRCDAMRWSEILCYITLHYNLYYILLHCITSKAHYITLHYIALHILYYKRCIHNFAFKRLALCNGNRCNFYTSVCCRVRQRHVHSPTCRQLRKEINPTADYISLHPASAKVVYSVQIKSENSGVNLSRVNFDSLGRVNHIRYRDSITPACEDDIARHNGISGDMYISEGYPGLTKNSRQGLRCNVQNVILTRKKSSH